jgi:hypothetical protein
MIPPPIVRQCCGAGGKPCPTAAQLPIDDWRRKRCQPCAAKQRRLWKSESFRRNWAKYRLQRSESYCPRHPPRRTALIQLAAEAGLLGRAA